ncbi:zinc ribbon domain-containing protein [Amycolatopsis samaneae]|uniref:Zinc ribbon domain-containing protein n=1 Tax=Amycolatopsis samaneae TaxID=664691 RepID=A0ABW5GSB4_9PSEU
MGATGPVRRCEVCGAPVTEGEAFCGNCGAYLDWGTPSAPAPAPPPAPPGASPQQPVPAPPPPAVPRTGFPTPQPPVPPAPTPSQAPPPSAPPPGVAPAEAAPVRPEQPGAVQPAKPVEKRPSVRAPDGAGVPVGPDDRPCPNCGTPNAPGRRFCRDCGAVLGETAAEVPKVPWWRRIRPPRFRGRLRFPVFLLVLVLLAVVAGLLIRYGPDIVTAVKDKTTTPVALTPQTITASSEAGGHPAKLAMDGFTNRFWAPANPAPAQGEYLDARFGRACRVLDVVVNNGASAEREVFNTQARPSALELTMTTEDGKRQTSVIRLADQPGPQHTALAVSDVTGLRLTVTGAYGTAPGRVVALGEVEFFGRC